MLTTQTRACPLPVEIKRAEDGTPVGMTGLAAVYYDGTTETEYRIDQTLVERIAPGALDDADMSDVMGLWNHDDSLMLGRNISNTLGLSLTDRGLRYDIPQLPRSRADLLEALERRDVQGSSFRFQMTTEGSRFEVDGDTQVIWVERILRVVDVGPVSNPAYSGTTAQARSDYVDAVRREYVKQAQSNEFEAYRLKAAAMLTGKGVSA